MLLGLTVAFGTIAIANTIYTNSPHTKRKQMLVQEEGKKMADKMVADALKSLENDLAFIKEREKAKEEK